MKSKIISSTILTFVIIFAGCTKDNYDPPTSFLTGNVVYNGNPIGVRSGATQLELWQNKWDTRGVIARAKIIVNIAQDGSYSSRLYDGNYKIVRLAGGPWANQTDSIDVTVSGTAKVDVPVTPYFIITGENFTNNAGVITSTCTVTKVGTLNISSLTLYVGVTNIVDANNNSLTNVISSSGLTDLSTPKTNTVTLNATLAARKYVYVRLGVATSGVGERLYTPVRKITF
jgi:hypothetical protein